MPVLLTTCYIPQEVTFSLLDGKIVEGRGVEPDIVMPMDFDAWNMGNGPDNQLDRALQFIRTGNREISQYKRLKNFLH